MKRELTPAKKAGKIAELEYQRNESLDIASKECATQGNMNLQQLENLLYCLKIQFAKAKRANQRLAEMGK